MLPQIPQIATSVETSRSRPPAKNGEGSLPHILLNMGDSSRPPAKNGEGSLPHILLNMGDSEW